MPESEGEHREIGPLVVDDKDPRPLPHTLLGAHQAARATKASMACETSRSRTAKPGSRTGHAVRVAEAARHLEVSAPAAEWPVLDPGFAVLEREVSQAIDALVALAA
jgi:hypothetical protein